MFMGHPAVEQAPRSQVIADLCFSTSFQEGIIRINKYEKLRITGYVRKKYDQTFALHRNGSSTSCAAFSPPGNPSALHSCSTKTFIRLQVEFSRCCFDLQLERRGECVQWLTVLPTATSAAARLRWRLRGDPACRAERWDA